MTITLTRFDRAFTKNLWTDESRYDAEGSGYTMTQYMADCIKRHSYGVNEPRYWSFAFFKTKKHEKHCISHNSAVVLEYDLSQLNDVYDRVSELGLAYWFVQTETKSENRFAIIFPLAEAIECGRASNRYARLASVLLNQINCAGAVEGCIAPTFLIRPIGNAPMAFVPGKYLDAATYIKETETMKAKAGNFIGDGIAPTPPASDNLFVGGGF